MLGFLRKIFRNRSRDEEFITFCRHSSSDEVTEALESWGYPNARDRTRRTPLMSAAALNEDSFVITMLVAAGADINARDIADNTPLDYAYHFKNQGAIETLENMGAQGKGYIQVRK